MKRLCILCAVLLASTFQARAEVFVVGVENISYLPHYGFEDGEYVGFGRALLDAFAADTGHRFEYRPLPVLRLMRELLDGKVDAKYPDSPGWSADMKAETRVAYSDPVVSHIDGLHVTPENLGKGIEAIETIGLITGYTAWPILDDIAEHDIQVTETPRFSGLFRQALIGRIDALYSERSVIEFQLRQAGVPGALVFDETLPYGFGSYRMSSVTHPELIDAFNRWMAHNQVKVGALRREYGLD